MLFCLGDLHEDLAQGAVEEEDGRGHEREVRVGYDVADVQGDVHIDLDTLENSLADYMTAV